MINIYSNYKDKKIKEYKLFIILNLYPIVKLIWILKQISIIVIKILLWIIIISNIIIKIIIIKCLC